MSKKERRAAKKLEASHQSPQNGNLNHQEYEAKLDQLHMELVKMQYWIKAEGKKLVVLFEGRDAAGMCARRRWTKTLSRTWSCDGDVTFLPARRLILVVISS